VLRTSLNVEKIIVVAHSFGSVLGVLMVKERPDLFYAYVGTAQIADLPRNYVVAYDELVEKARSVEQQRAFEELRTVGPPPYADGQGYAVQRKWANRFEGADRFIASMTGFGLGAPGYSIRDLNDWFEGQLVSAQALIPESSGLDAETLGGEFEVPMFVFQGEEDFTTPTRLATSYVDAIRAPLKAFVAIEGGHFSVFMNSDEFLEQLITRVRPLADAE
jgi:pimeloyl-ACP methyl ester carboxylesterase